MRYPTSSRPGRGAVVAFGALALSIAVGVSTPVSAQAGGGEVRFSSSYVEAGEGADFVSIAVERSGGLQVSRLRIDFATDSGTARGGSDYTDLAGTLVFEVGEARKSFAVRIRDDKVVESHEQFEIRLSNPRGDAAALGAPATVAIRDDDAPPGNTSVEEVPGATLAPAIVEPNPVLGVADESSNRPALRNRRPRAPLRREVTYRQGRITPFEMRSTTTPEPLGRQPGVVDPVLAIVAGLLLARVAAQAWFRSHLDREPHWTDLEPRRRNG